LYIKEIFDPNGVSNDRLYYENTFTEPKSITNHESYVYVREVKLISWSGAKSGILTIENLDDFF